MLQQKKPKDFVISSGNPHSVKDFVNRAAKYLDIDIRWKGKGLDEVAINYKSKKKIIRIKKTFFRPNDINYTYGNSLKAMKLLKWKPSTNFDALVKLMCDAEIKKFNL